MKKVFLLCTLVLFANCEDVKSVSTTPIVTLDSGIYEGLSKRLPGATQEIHQYLGIPFAAPPTRFAPPQPPPKSNAVKKAQEFPPACIQAKNSTAKESEDCLYLNIYVPVPNGKNDRAVMIFLYGGGLQSGDASSSLYDGTSFATNQDVIIVVPNYRTNVFGFPGDSPSILARERNLGFLDQRRAFDFVQENILKFGGDPKKVTLFGQSAGARSADFHVLTLQNPPFRAVIMESGSAELVPLADIRRATQNSSKVSPFSRLASAVGCNANANAVIECMHNVPAVKLKEVIVSQSLYFPCVDDNGFTTVKDEAAVRRLGKVAKVPIMMGTNLNEQTTTVKKEPNFSLDEYLTNVFPYPDLAQKIRTAYSVGKNAKYVSSFDAISSVETDFAYTCLTAREAKISADASIPTWRYLFNATYENIQAFPGSGAYHGAELRFVFGNLQNQNQNLEADEIFLSRDMQRSWAKFAKDPQSGPGWPKIGSSADDLGMFTTIFYDAKNHLVNISPKMVDRNCDIFQTMYKGRA